MTLLDIDFIKEKLMDLELKFYNIKDIWQISKTNEGLRMKDEPYVGLEVYIITPLSHYIVRVLGVTRLREKYSSTEDLMEVLQSVFSMTAVCVGNPALRG